MTSHRTSQKLSLSEPQRTAVIAYAKQLLLEGAQFKKPSLLVDECGDIRPSIINRHPERFPEGWSYLEKMRVDNLTLSPSELIDLFCTPLATDTPEVAFERNIFITRVLETLRSTDAPACDAPRSLKKIKLPNIPIAPLRSYPDNDFEAIVIGGDDSWGNRVKSIRPKCRDDLKPR